MEIHISLITDKKLIGWHGLDAQLNGFANSLLLNSITCPPVTGPAWSPEAPIVMLEKWGRLTFHRETHSETNPAALVSSSTHPWSQSFLLPWEEQNKEGKNGNFPRKMKNQKHSVLKIYMHFALSRFHLFVTLWTVAHQDLLSMGFPRPLGWVVISSSRDLPDPGMEPRSPVSPVLLVIL